MDFVTLFVVLGGLGGGYVAYWLAKLNRETPRPDGPIDPRHSRFSTDMINMAHINVAGVGGLGLVVMAVAVAFFIPSIGESIGTGLFFGTLFGIGLIARRRKAGPMPSSGRRPGARIMLALDDRRAPTHEQFIDRVPDGWMDCAARP